MCQKEKERFFFFSVVPMYFSDFRERLKEEFSLFVITQRTTKGMGLQTVVQTHYGMETYHLS